MTDDVIEIVDLEGRLKADETGSIRDELVGSFQSEATDWKQRMDKGLSPDDFEVANRIHKALETAGQVVTRYWDMSHPG